MLGIKQIKETTWCNATYYLKRTGEMTLDYDLTHYDNAPVYEDQHGHIWIELTKQQDRTWYHMLKVNALGYLRPTKIKAKEPAQWVAWYRKKNSADWWH